MYIFHQSPYKTGTEENPGQLSFGWGLGRCEFRGWLEEGAHCGQPSVHGDLSGKEAQREP